MSLPDLSSLPPSQPTLFVLSWDAGQCKIDGPFGEDAEAAQTFAIRLLKKNGDSLRSGYVEGAGVFMLNFHPITVE